MSLYQKEILGARSQLVSVVRCRCCLKSSRPLCKDCIVAIRSRLENGLTTKDISGVLGVVLQPSAPAPGKKVTAESDDDEDGPLLDFDGGFEGGNLGVAQARTTAFKYVTWAATEFHSHVAMC